MIRNLSLARKTFLTVEEKTGIIEMKRFMLTVEFIVVKALEKPKFRILFCLAEVA